MSRRARAIAFACAALACAGLAAELAGGYRAGAEDQFGPLTSVVVARANLPAREALDADATTRVLTVRRVPERFVPPGTLTSPAQAVGRAPAARIPAGSYVLAGQLARPHPARGRQPGAALDHGREPVEVEVSGAAALASEGGDPAGSRVDVVVTTEPGPGGRGRTFVAAQGVGLLALSQSASDADGLPGPGGDTWTATLALTRPQALRLIQAQNFAREVRLIPHPGS